MRNVPLFLAATVLGGVGGFVGSVLGGAFGKGALFAGLGAVARARLRTR